MDMNNIVMKLINAQENASLLEQIAYVPIMDLAAVFVHLEDDDSQDFVTEKDLTLSGIDKEQLASIALSNSLKRSPLIMASTDDFLVNFMPDQITGSEEETSDADSKEFCNMIMITNEVMKDGAIALLCHSAMQEVTDYFEDDIYVIPSSVDEILAVSCSMCHAEVLLELVYEFNRSLVEPGKQLSDNIYRINRGSRMISCISKERL